MPQPKIAGEGNPFETGMAMAFGWSRSDFARLRVSGCERCWLHLRMIGSVAPRGRKTANQVGAAKSASPCS